MTNSYLPTPLRRTLEKTVKAARVVAEEGARDAIRRLGVAEGKAPSYLSEVDKGLRRRLRAHARALGDAFDRATDEQQVKRLVEATAYVHWHRMLFARFLAERNLLRHPEHDAPVTLAECAELAEAEGLADGWAAAERYAAAMLPGVFRLDDPVLAVEFDPAHGQELNRLVRGLEPEIFQAEDSLGWTYQFWRAAEKDAVNKSGVKIGAGELPAVTQLFTEPYMVRFLLHNTLGAWWAGKMLAGDPALAETAPDEDALRAACALPGYDFDMLRFVREGDGGRWRPAAGTFPGWPTEAAAITMLDPCCGSGHFLTEALAILAALRQAEEGLSRPDAVAAVLRDNLHGLEIDGRCVQIAAFAVALTAWRIGGWQTLQWPHIAWVGAPPPLPKREFVALADSDAEFEYALAALHELFAQAPLLGSLIEPAGGDLFQAEKMREIERLLEPLIEKARRAEPERIEGVIAARGMTDAASMLHRKYVLQSTNVPFLGRGKQNQSLVSFISRRHADAKADLATAMLTRMMNLGEPGGTISAVSPQNWLFLGSYKSLRRGMLENQSMNLITVLGEHGFDSPAAAGAFTALAVFSNIKPRKGSTFLGMDVSVRPNPTTKSENLANGKLSILNQLEQRGNPDFRITPHETMSKRLLSSYCASFLGLGTGDLPKYTRKIWEVSERNDVWTLLQGAVESPCHWGGCDSVVAWDRSTDRVRGLSPEEKEQIHNQDQSGQQAWGRPGVSVALMRKLKASLYSGSRYEKSISVLIPKDPSHLPAIWAFVSDSSFNEEVRKIDQNIIVANGTLVKVHFDIDYWRDVAKQKYPNGLPEPYSDYPTQWLFHGHPGNAIEGGALHVALARLCGYRWPGETDRDIRLSEKARAWVAKVAELPAADKDGLLGVPAVAGEKPLVDRLRTYLAAAIGSEWSDALERRLVAEADETLDKKAARDGSLDAWLRDRAFRQHCALFGHRPFLWHIWDGLKDGFSVFVHYHRFDQANLRKLTYTMLGDWLARAKAEDNQLRYEKGRELQQMLEKVLEGEAPYDIFVRWKSLAQQPLGWDPDLDDGVRMNIRPFVEAGILRDTPKIKWAKDRGKDATSAPWYPVFKGERINDHHTTLAEKQAAREALQKGAAE